MKTEKPTLAEVAETRLAEDILTGRLVPGRRLRLIDMMKAYSVGMSPLREALARLSGRGLVKLTGQRGFSVAPVSLAELTDLTITRRRLETMALRLSIEAGDAAWEADVLGAHHRLSRHQRRDDRLVDDVWERLHRHFHFTLFAACGSPCLLSFCHGLYDQFDRYRRLAVLTAGHHPSLRGIHGSLVEAALEGKAEVAAKLLEDHIEEVKAEILRLAGSQLFPELTAQSTEPFADGQCLEDRFARTAL